MSKIDSLDAKSFNQYLYQEKNLSQKASSVYANTSRFGLIKKYFGDKEWSRENFRALICDLEERGRKNSTINKFITSGKHIDGYLGTDIVTGFEYRREKLSKIEDLLTLEEIKQMAEVHIPYKKHCDYLNQRQNALFMLMGSTGCRISEALDLKWSEFYPTASPHVVFLDTKNGEDREAPLPKDVFKLIDSLPKRGKKVFESGRGKNLSPQDCNSDLKRRARACGITKRVYNHLFRHSFISATLEDGASESDVMKIVGHRDYKSLLRYKNSRLEHYLEVLRYHHPFFANEVSWVDRVTRLEDEIKKLFDLSSHSIELSKEDHQIRLKIRQLTAT